MEKNYLFSIVMAVYNVENYIAEAIESVINQTIGFEKIQLILVDDGTKDNSGLICDGYAEKYPENIVVIHKENGGVSSARNAGKQVATGKYVNFLDADDKLSLDACEQVYKFFQQSNGETDVVSIPLVFFGEFSGDHILNYKYKKGTRVISLLKEYDAIQLSASSCFFCNEVISKYEFDTRLCYAEDAKFINEILLDKKTLGVVAEAKYYYRKRELGEQSAIQTSANNKMWYLPYLRFFVEDVIKTCKNIEGYIPNFIQYTLAYDLQWRIKQPGIPTKLLDDLERVEFKNLLKVIIKEIDTEIWLEQKSLFREHKLYCCEQKPELLFDVYEPIKKDIYTCIGDNVICNLKSMPVQIRLIKLEKTAAIITVAITVSNYYKDLDIKAKSIVNGVETYIQGEQLPKVGKVTSLSIPIAEKKYYRFTIPLTAEKNFITFSYFYKDKIIDISRPTYYTLAPIGNKYENCYYESKGWHLEQNEKGVVITEKSKSLVENTVKKLRFLSSLYRNKSIPEAKKSLFVRLILPFIKVFYGKHVWLVFDRYDKADDNGEVFFEYLQNNHKEINSFFVVSKKSPDYKRIQSVGPVLDANSWKHKLLYYIAEVCISSQANSDSINPLWGHEEPFRDLSANKPFVFLQHGIIKDDLSTWLNIADKDLSMFVTSTRPEYMSVLQYDYGYNESVVKLTGLPRHDKLQNTTKKMIAIVPSWRAYLVNGYDEVKQRNKLIPNFTESSYYKMYSAVFSNKKLFDEAERLGYTIAYRSHPNLVATMDIFETDKRMVLLDPFKPYREVFGDAALLVTDYSSVAFDFAYLRKPIVYYQSDCEEFFSGAHTYEKGYFEYKRDGFGEVEYTSEQLVDRLIEYMKNDCKLKEEYRNRIDQTFIFSDKNNCERVYQEICGILGEQ